MMECLFKSQIVRRAVLPGIVLLTGITGCTESRHSSGTTNPAEIRSIGCVMHRGKYHDIKDLLNPTYRAESDDPFVKSFAPDHAVAVPWAGSWRKRSVLERTQEVSNSPPLHQDLPTIPWAGRDNWGDDYFDQE